MTRSAAERQELAAQIALLAAPGLSPSRMVRLITEHGSGLAALRALPHECDEAIAAALATEAVRARVRRALHTLHTWRVQTMAFTDAPYPERLRQRLAEHAPPLLFARGRPELLDMPCIAVVGCRRATQYGLDIAAEIGDGVARARGCIVSGLALGIDAAAHAAALEADGATIGVLGCGVDVHYPRQNIQLQDRVARDGLLLSELLPGMPPLRHHFTYRNRIIAALSEAVIVVEAGERSGAVATGNHAVGAGVRVLGVMNAMHLPNVQGILELFRDGAEIYTGIRDLLESAGLIGLGAALPEAAVPAPPPRHAVVWEALDREPLHTDDIARAAGLGSAQTLSALLELELDGCARQLAGNRFVRVCRPPAVPAALGRARNRGARGG
jgi:DNA processing protein